MPLVTRTAVSGNIYRQATEPPDWLNGDLWVNTSSGQLYVNISGTATAVQPTITASRLAVSNASGELIASSVTSTEAGYVSGVTSAIQSQINGKQAIVSGVSDTEIGYLDGVTSAIQTQIDGIGTWKLLAFSQGTNPTSGTITSYDIYHVMWGVSGVNNYQPALRFNSDSGANYNSVGQDNGTGWQTSSTTYAKMTNNQAGAGKSWYGSCFVDNIDSSRKKSFTYTAASGGASYTSQGGTEWNNTSNLITTISLHDFYSSAMGSSSYIVVFGRNVN